MINGMGLIAIVCIFGAALLGFVLARTLPEDNRGEATRDVVRSVMSVVGILAALVLGLLIAGSKANLDARSDEVAKFAANLTLLDRELMHFEADDKGLRALLRAFTARKIALAWPADRHQPAATHDAEAVRTLDEIQQRLRALTTPSETQGAGRTNALTLVADLQRTSRLLAVAQESQIPRPFLVAVLFWLSMLFGSYALFAPLNRTVVAALLVGAVSVSIALNLIFDMDQPFAGLVRVSSAPMQQALDEMKPAEGAPPAR